MKVKDAQKRLNNHFKIQILVGLGSIFNGLKILADLIKILELRMIVAGEKEVIQEKEAGEKMIEFLGDLHHMKKDMLLHIHKIKMK